MTDKRVTKSKTEWVDPFLGNAASDLPAPEGIARRWWCAKPPVGNTHPGATLPFGMVSVCSYSGAYVTGYGQYALSLSGDPPEKMFERHEALGLAHFQQSGTGRIRMYYNYYLTMPLGPEGTGSIGERYLLDSESAKPGFYSGSFPEIGCDFEVTCTKRTAVHTYHFPEDRAGKVAIDFSSGGLLIDGMKTYPESAMASFSNQSTCKAKVEIEGIPYYAHIECFSPIKESGFWKASEQLTGMTAFTVDAETKKAKDPFGIWFESAEPGLPVEIRIGFSLHDPDRPTQAIELNRERSAAAIAQRANEMWESVLSKINVEGGSPMEHEVFYSALYHATLKPGDFMDENPFSGKEGPFFFDLSTLWDLYKTQLPLLMTLWPELGADFVSFLEEVATREGAFPISYSMDNGPERFAKQATGLCHMILNDAHMRGIPGDWDNILALLWKTSLSGKGRGGKFAEFSKNHVVQPLSHTLDLAFANWCISQMAKRLGDQIIYDKSIPHAYHWRNAFDEKTGLLREDSDYYEGENWNYSFRFLHDMVGRINLAGGEERFCDLLDRFFGYAEPGEGETVHHFEGLNNEPDMEAPYAYLFAGRHDRTAEIVRSVMRYQFTTGKGGLPGNDDSGGLSSWFVWSAMGLFPVTGMPLILIGSPLFEKTTLNLLGGPFTVKALNQAPDHYYVQQAWLNGNPLDRCYLKLSEFGAEAELTLEMGPEPNGWSSGTRPPSFIS